MLSRIPREVWISLASIILTALTSFYIPKLLEVNSIELEYFERNKNEYISIPDLLDGRVELLVDGKPQKNLTSIDILLFNRSYKDLKNIPITFEFESPDPSKPIKLLSKQFSKPESFPKDSVTESSHKSNDYVRYNITSFPRDDDYSTDFVASFIFLGDQTPIVKVQSDFTDGKVIDIYEYDQSRRNTKELILVLSIATPIAALFVIFLIWQSKKDRERLLKKIEAEATALIKDANISDKSVLAIENQVRHIAVESYLAAIGKKPKQTIDTQDEQEPYQ